MKKYLLIFALLLGAVSSWGQTTADQAAVLQKCIDLPELQQHYPVNTDGTHQEIYIMQHAVNFPGNIEVSKFGKKPVFLDKDSMYNGNAKGFFLFETFKISADIAEVSLLYNLKTQQGYRAVDVQLELHKEAGNWNVSETNINWR